MGGLEQSLMLESLSYVMQEPLVLLSCLTGRVWVADPCSFLALQQQESK